MVFCPGVCFRTGGGFLDLSLLSSKHLCSARPPKRSPGTDLPASLQPEVIFQSAVGYNRHTHAIRHLLLFLLYLVIYFGCPGSLLLCVCFLWLPRVGDRGFSSQWLLWLWSMYSRLLGFSNFGVLLRGIWDLPGPGIGPVFPVLAGRFLTTGPPGKSFPYFLHLQDGQMSGMQAFVAYIPVPTTRLRVESRWNRAVQEWSSTGTSMEEGVSSSQTCHGRGDPGRLA